MFKRLIILTSWIQLDHDPLSRPVRSADELLMLMCEGECVYTSNTVQALCLLLDKR